MSASCGLRVSSECFGNLEASQDGVYNGRPQYFFSFTYIGNLVNAWIYWSPDDSSWFVQDLTTGQNISYLPFDRIHPYGTYLEWENVSLLTYGCLSNSASFESTFYDICPPSNFQFCCPSDNEVDNFIGVQSFDYFGYFGITFYLESSQFSGCATLIDSQIPNGSIIYDSIYSATSFTRCIECTGTTQPCSEQPVFPIPTPTPVLTADTGCGITLRLINECLPITIPSLYANCEVSNISRQGLIDGEIELTISGGTPPYSIIWSNGESTTYLTNLQAGTYTYTVTDYYGDFVLTDSCVVAAAPEPTPIPSLSNFCLTIQVLTVAVNRTFISNNWDGVGIPSYISDGYEIFWNESSTPSVWNLISTNSNIGGGLFTNTNPEFPPLNGWVYTGLLTGSANGVLGDCQDLGNYRMTIEVDSFYNGTYRIQFQPYQTVNGKLSWIDTNNFYRIFWNQGNTSADSYWYLENLISTPRFEIVNFNPQSPPTNSWFVLGREGTVTFQLGNAYSSILCAVVGSICETENIVLNEGPMINGNPSWYGILPCSTPGNAWILYYNNIRDNWTTSGLTTVAGITAEATLYNDLYQGPFGEYTTDGNFILSVSEGECGSQGNLRMSVSVNNPQSGNDGSIIISPLEGTPPFEYSIDGGTTYFSFPIFDNLSSGTYVPTIKDNNGFIKKQSVILTSPPPRTVYEVSLNTTSRRTINTSTTTTIIYTSTVNVTPQLPSGTTITFNLTHNDNYKVSPIENASSSILGSQLLKNNNLIPITYSEVNTSTITNTQISCQSNLIYITATTNYWNVVSMSSAENVNIETTVTTLRNGNYSCYLSENIETFSMSNLKISGCSNCEVVNQSSILLITPTPTKTPTPTPSKPLT